MKFYYIKHGREGFLPRKKSKQPRHTNKLTPWFLPFFAALIAAILLFYLNDQNKTEQSLTYFPEDQNHYFVSHSTTLSISPMEQANRYTLEWMETSKTNSPTYLRQDVSLLFEDGKLKDTMSQWKQDMDEIKQEKSLEFEDSGYFEAITVHHEEIHYPNDEIRGKETMSYDHLYVMTDPLNAVQDFQVPISPEEQDWYTAVERAQRQERHYVLEQAMAKYDLNLNDYYIFPLTYLHVFKHNNLPGLDMATSKRAISQLWEGLYKNYVLGIQVNEEITESPIGSTMPLILYSKKADHFLIIVHTKKGHIVLLKSAV